MAHIADIKIEMVPLRDIIPYENNPRTHDRKQIKALKRSLQTNGNNSPLVVDEDNVILVGHGRCQALLELGWEYAPVVRVTHLSEAAKRAYRLLDNQLGATSYWDNERLAVEFQAIVDGGLELEMATAFTTGEIDFVLGQAAEAKGPDVAPEDVLPHAPGEAPLVSRCDDLWRLGEHFLLCGDARDPAAIARVMQGERARMAFVDFPYNVKIDGFATGKGAVRHPEFAMASGEMTPDRFTHFLGDSLRAMTGVCVNGAIIFACMDWRHLMELSTAATTAGLQTMNIIVWVKTNGGMGTFYRSRHEFIFAFKYGDAPHVNTFELGQGGRFRTNVWEYRGANAFGPTRADDLAGHPTVKPAAMVADAIKDVSKRGDIVIDFFSGSGTTLIAAQMTGRRARAIEIAPVYVDLAIRRWQRATGKTAVHAETGRSFEAEEELRAHPNKVTGAAS